MKSYLIEAIGTFFLVLVIGLTAGAGAPLAPLAIGAILMVMVYMGGHVSGAHYNPAVTLAVWLRGKIDAAGAAGYVVSQLAGAILAAFVSVWLVGSNVEVAPGAGYTALQALVSEFLFTFALASVVLNVATSSDHPNNSFYGLAIGFTVAASAFAIGPISGAALNPAVALGHDIAGGTLGTIWIYLVGPGAGGAIAALVFRLTNPHEWARG